VKKTFAKLFVVGLLLVLVSTAYGYVAAEINSGKEALKHSEAELEKIGNFSDLTLKSSKPIEVEYITDYGSVRTVPLYIINFYSVDNDYFGTVGVADNGRIYVDDVSDEEELYEDIDGFENWDLTKGY
jgi:hypothetical protein